MAEPSIDVLMAALPEPGEPPAPEGEGGAMSTEEEAEALADAAFDALSSGDREGFRDAFLALLGI